MKSAFHGRTDVAATLIARLKNNAQAERLALSAFAWTGEKGSMVGCMLENADASLWESEFGLPQWLALVADKAAEETRATESAVAFGTRLLETIRPGADLTPVGSQFILWLLDDLKARIPVPSGAAQQALDGIERLHRCVTDNNPPPPQEWRAARRAATAATDEASDQLSTLLKTCVETAGWNPATSPAVVYDTLRTWVTARRLLAAIDAGWSIEYEPTLRAHMKELFDKYLKDQPELQKTLTVFQLLAEHYPEDDRLVRLKNTIDREADKASYAHAADVLLQMLQAV